VRPRAGGRGLRGWKGTDKLGVPFDEHVMNVVAGLTPVRGELEL
jgi:hypothetical protein